MYAGMNINNWVFKFPQLLWFLPFFAIFLVHRNISKIGQKF